jgi:hypothetical protein
MQRNFLVCESFNQWMSHIRKIYVVLRTQAYSGELTICRISFISSCLCLVKFIQLFAFWFNSLSYFIFLNKINVLLVLRRDLSFWYTIFKVKIIFVHYFVLFFKLINIIITAILFGINLLIYIVILIFLIWLIIQRINNFWNP